MLACPGNDPSLLIRCKEFGFDMRKSILALFLFAALRGWAQSGLDDQWIAFDRAGSPNSDLQCFRSSNVSERGGNLVLQTHRETASCESIDLKRATYEYTSSSVAMRSFRFLYGTVEFRAKFGGGNHSGSWPAVWMLDASCQASDPTGTDDRCNGQEIDIAEIMDGNFSQINEQIHVDGYSRHDGCEAPVWDASRNYHTYKLIWSPGSLVFKIDGSTTCKIEKPYVPNSPMYLKASVYVGKYGGRVNDQSLPWVTTIDYVKITRGKEVLFEDDFNGAVPAGGSPSSGAKAPHF